MTTAPVVPGTTAALAAGIETHRRSLLVWPTLLDDSAAALLRVVATTGARLLAFDEPLPAELTGGMPPVALTSWCDDTAPGPDTMAGNREPSAGTPGGSRWSEIVALHRECGLVPLPPSVRAASEWRHAWLADGSHDQPDARSGGDVVATASMQQVTNPIGPAAARHLVACVATRPAARRRGVAARCVAAVRAAAAGPCAAITENRVAAGFFEHVGWRRYQTVWLYRWQ